MKYLLGIDFGGGSSKATLLSEAGEVVSTSAKEYPTHYPRNGWAEQDPDDSYLAFLHNVRAIVNSTGINPEDIEAIALDGATHTAVLLDENDKLVRPAIYWTDKRSIEQSDFLAENHSKLIMEQSLNAPGPLWTLPQLMWLRENEGESFKKIKKVMFIKDYVRYRLTGDFVTDYIEAMGSMLMDARNNVWSEELCEIAGLDIDVLPRIVSPDSIVSPITETACRETGLSQKTKVVAGATDTAMEVLASGAIKKGQATVKLATAGRICSVTDKGIVSPLLVNYKHVVPGLWYPGAATKSCAASYRWYRDVFCTAETADSKALGKDGYETMNEAAAKVPAGSDNLFFHPYLQGEITPYLDNNLRASFIGISSFHTKAHFTRAVMEGVAYSLLDSLRATKELGIKMDSAVIIGGGAKGKLWRQIVADVLNIPLRKNVVDDSSLGSAMFAGVATGVFSSFKDCVGKCVRKESDVYPNPDNREVYEKGFEMYKMIQAAMAPVYKEISYLET